MIGSLGSFAGFTIIEDPTMMNTDPDKADWSKCRSPSRARRRWRQGHPQRVFFGPSMDFISIGRVVRAHPAAIRALRSEVANRKAAGEAPGGP